MVAPSARPQDGVECGVRDGVQRAERDAAAPAGACGGDREQPVQDLVADAGQDPGGVENGGGAARRERAHIADGDQPDERAGRILGDVDVHAQIGEQPAKHPAIATGRGAQNGREARQILPSGAAHAHVGAGEPSGSHRCRGS